MAKLLREVLQPFCCQQQNGLGSLGKTLGNAGVSQHYKLSLSPLDASGTQRLFLSARRVWKGLDSHAQEGRWNKTQEAEDLGKIFSPPQGPLAQI